MARRRGHCFRCKPQPHPREGGAVGSGIRPMVSFTFERVHVAVIHTVSSGRFRADFPDRIRTFPPAHSRGFFHSNSRGSSLSNSSVPFPTKFARFRPFEFARFLPIEFERSFPNQIRAVSSIRIHAVSSDRICERFFRSGSSGFSNTIRAILERACAHTSGIFLSVVPYAVP